METVIKNAEQNEKFVHKLFLWAGISSIAIAIGYVIITVLFVISGTPLPKDAATWIAYLDGKIYLWWIIIWLSIITDILYLPVSYGLYEMFKKNQKGIMLISMVLFVLFVFLELSVTWSKYPSLLEIFSRYKATSVPEIRLVLTAAIETISAEFQTSVTSFYCVFVPSIAVILVSYAMLISKVGYRFLSIIGFISGSCNAISSMGKYLYSPIENLVVVGSFLSLFWFLGIGIILIKQRNMISQ